MPGNGCPGKRMPQGGIRCRRKRRNGNPQPGRREVDGRREPPGKHDAGRGENRNGTTFPGGGGNEKRRTRGYDRRAPSFFRGGAARFPGAGAPFRDGDWHGSGILRSFANLNHTLWLLVSRWKTSPNRTASRCSSKISRSRSRRAGAWPSWRRTARGKPRC